MAWQIFQLHNLKINTLIKDNDQWKMALKQWALLKTTDNPIFVYPVMQWSQTVFCNTFPSLAKTGSGAGETRLRWEAAGPARPPARNGLFVVGGRVICSWRMIDRAGSVIVCKHAQYHPCSISGSRGSSSTTAAHITGQVFNENIKSQDRRSAFIIFWKNLHFPSMRIAHLFVGCFNFQQIFSALQHCSLRNSVLHTNLG